MVYDHHVLYPYFNTDYIYAWHLENMKERGIIMSEIEKALDKLADQAGDLNPIELFMEATIAKRQEAKKKSKKKEKVYDNGDPIPAPDDFMNPPVAE